MVYPKSRPGVLRSFGKMPEEIGEYFKHFFKLTKDNFPWDVVIVYLFSRVELAHNMTIYCGVVKCHKVNSSLARKAVETHHMTRKEFQEKFKVIFGKEVPRNVAKYIKFPEGIRDKILHGKPASEADKRKAVFELLIYAKKFNEALNRIAGFKPFGSLQGFAGGSQPLNKETSRWVLKGMGFSSLS